MLRLRVTKIEGKEYPKFEIKELQISDLRKSEKQKRNFVYFTRKYRIFQEEGIAFCQKTLACEEKLKWHELICQRQCAYPNLILGSYHFYMLTCDTITITEINIFLLMIGFLQQSADHNSFS